MKNYFKFVLFIVGIFIVFSAIAFINRKLNKQFHDLAKKPTQSTKPEVDMPQGKDEISNGEVVDPPPPAQTTEPIPIITSEEAQSLMELAQNNGYDQNRVVDYMKSLHYETEGKTVLQILQQLNRWDHETCVLHFEQEASPIEDVPKEMIINPGEDDV